MNYKNLYFKSRRIDKRITYNKISYDLSIASFVILGDTEIVEKTAPLIAVKLPEVDFVVTAEAKGIPLAYEISKALGLKEYIVARKSIKAYMVEPIEVGVNSITTSNSKKLYSNNEKDVKKLTSFFFKISRLILVFKIELNSLRIIYIIHSDILQKI